VSIDGEARTAVRQLPDYLVTTGLLVGIAAICTSPVLVRLGHVPAFALAFWRCLAGAVLIAPFAWRQRRGRPPLARGEAGQLLASGAFLAVHFALFNASLSFTTVASAAVLVSASPLFVGLGAALIGEPPSRRAWLGICLATAGAAVIGLGDVAEVDLGPRALLGDAMAFSGAAAFAGYLLLGRSARRRLPLAAYATSVYGTAALLLLPASLVTGAELAGYRTQSWLVIAAVIAGPQLLGHTVFNGLLSTVTATVVAVVTLTEPVGASLLAWLIFDELPPVWLFVGAVPVLAGVWLVTTQGVPRSTASGE
jgi:drug/metabolite transporter (DMT)-like permease